MRQRSGAYVIRNVLNGNRYIGSALDVDRRWKGHRRDLRRGRHQNPHLQAAWKTYGEAAFCFEVIEECPPQMLLESEQRLLDALQPEYNICRRAGSPLGIKRSDATKTKISAALKGNRNCVGRRPSEATRAKLMGNRNCVGRKMGTATRMKISAAKKRNHEIRRAAGLPVVGHPLSEETRQKLSLALKEYHIKRRPPRAEVQLLAPEGVMG